MASGVLHCHCACRGIPGQFWGVFRPLTDFRSSGFELSALIAQGELVGLISAPFLEYNIFMFNLSFLLNFKTYIICASIAFVVGLGTGGSGVAALKNIEIKKRVEELAEFKATETLAKKVRDQEQMALNKKIIDLQKEADNQINSAQKALEDYKVSTNKLLAAKDSQINDLKLLQKTKQSRLIELETELAGAKNETERIRIQSEIDLQKASLGSTENRIKGLECLDATIPSEYIANINNGWSDE